MKIKTVFFLFLLLFLYSCQKEEEPLPTKDFTFPFMQFRLLGSPVVYVDPLKQIRAVLIHENEIGSRIENVLDGAPISPTRISFHFQMQETIRGEDILSLAGQTISFDTSQSIYVSLYTNQGTIEGKTFSANNPIQDNFIQVQQVYRDTNSSFDTNGTNSALRAYRIEGIFNCKISGDVTSSIYELADGCFSLEFKEGS